MENNLQKQFTHWSDVLKVSKELLVPQVDNIKSIQMSIIELQKDLSKADQEMRSSSEFKLWQEKNAAFNAWIVSELDLDVSDGDVHLVEIGTKIIGKMTK